MPSQLIERKSCRNLALNDESPLITIVDTAIRQTSPLSLFFRCAASLSGKPLFQNQQAAHVRRMTTSDPLYEFSQ